MACFFDIKKCFDSINHAILLRQLALYGIHGPELQWFKNYLSGRRQSVSCNDSNSGICNISTGNPQGSHKKSNKKSFIASCLHNFWAQYTTYYTQPTKRNLTPGILHSAVIHISVSSPDQLHNTLARSGLILGLHPANERR